PRRAMRHRRAGYKLGRNATHRLALYRNLALALFRHERIVTTLEKAKAVRPFVEKLITLAKKAAVNPEKALHARRLVLARLAAPAPRVEEETPPTEQPTEPEAGQQTEATGEQQTGETPAPEGAVPETKGESEEKK